MKSLYATILSWFAVLLAISVAVILFSAPMIALRFAGRDGPLDRTNLVFLRQARQAFEKGGKDGLNNYLSNLATQLPARYVLLDAAYRDLVTGEDRSRLAEAGAARFFARRQEGGIVRIYSEGDVYLVALIQPPREDRAGSLPYILLVATVAAVLCWLFASRLAKPVRELARTMDSFGQGHTSVRSTIRRADELGGLAVSFNQMADRIEALVAAERRLIQDVSHELQSPLARMAVAAKLARSASDPEVAAARMQKEIARLSSLIGGLLDITRAEGDPASRRMESVDLRDLLETITEDCATEAEEKGCQISARLTNTVINADRELLHRVFENILRNAVRYSPNDATIDIDLFVAEQRVTITIRDRGPGVPEDALERIFAPFYRVENSRDAATGGTGIGLSLAQRAVLLHRGAIRAENADPGLRVTVELPGYGGPGSITK